jgi:hypothetical protein
MAAERDDVEIAEAERREKVKGDRDEISAPDMPLCL